jgi:hypothetical protein
MPHLRQSSSDPRVRPAHPLTRQDEPRRPAVRRDADGGLRIGPTWESVTERVIREAQEAGAFDDLPGRGRRFELDDDPREGELGLAFHILRVNHEVPPWIAADRDVRASLDAIEAIFASVRAAATGRGGRAARARALARLEQAIEAHDRAVEALNATAPSVTLQRRPLDRAALSDRLERAFTGGATEASGS